MEILEPIRSDSEYVPGLVGWAAEGSAVAPCRIPANWIRSVYREERT